MNLKENLKQAVTNLKVNRMRTFLTMLGIIIGIGAVITITTLGASLQKTLEMSFQSIGGTNQITAFMNYQPPEDADEDDWVEWTEDDYLSMEDLANFQEAFEGRVRNVILESYMGEATAMYSGKPGGDPIKVNIIGTTAGYLESNGLKLLRGRDLTARDQTENKAVALVSDLYVKYACEGESPIGKEIDFEQENGQVSRAYVVGVYRFNRSELRAMQRGNEGSGEPFSEKDIQTKVFLPYQHVENNLKDDMYDTGGIQDFTIMAQPGEDVEALQEEIKAWFAENKWADSNFVLETWSSMAELEEIQKVLQIVTIVISVIAAISLLVGGVGVMNIMLVSVVERTREIGIRKALGAQNRDIERQFLSETILICLIGGILGVLFGLALGFIGARVGSTIVQDRIPDMAEFGNVAVRPSPVAILVSVGFSVLTGLVFGLYPARRAARMSPIDALRYE